MPDDTPPIFDPAEDCPWRSPREILARCGYTPLPPNALNDQQLPGRLWELLYAAAARRIFFHYTNHLDDRSFYTYLWNAWLDKPTADLPPEAETNTNYFVAIDDVWLRYYADTDDRDFLRTRDSACVLPSHEVTPFDRDRFLPTPPISLEAHAGWLPGDDDAPEGSEDDPLGLTAVDRDIAAAKVESSPELAYYERSESALNSEIEGPEPEYWSSPAQQFADHNIPLLPPDEITDETLTPILWELIHNLSLFGVYLLHTDHLSDLELYGELWERGMRDPACLPGRNPRGGWYHDILGSWGEAEVQLNLRYYASDEERDKHAKEWPAVHIPLKEKPIMNRDWRLPKGPF